MNQLGEVRLTRHLVLHDYGMGGLWWWVRAESAEELVRACAEVEVVTDPEAVERAETWALEEVHLDAPNPNPLSGFRASGMPSAVSLVSASWRDGTVCTCAGRKTVTKRSS